jgi:hypothetical protein
MLVRVVYLLTESLADRGLICTRITAFTTCSDVPG